MYLHYRVWILTSEAFINLEFYFQLSSLVQGKQANFSVSKSF